MNQFFRSSYRFRFQTCLQSSFQSSFQSCLQTSLQSSLQRFLQTAALAALGLFGSASSLLANDQEKVDFFESRIRPVLIEHCYACHSAESGTAEGLLYLDSKNGWEKGGESGPALVPGQVEQSLLLLAIRRSDKDLAMPPDYELPPQVVQDFSTWILMGAVDPRDSVATPLSEEVDTKQRELTPKEQWAFSVPQKPTPPTTQSADWSQHPIDQFIMAQLESRGIEAAAVATPQVLVRRLYYDLIGLPPTSSEVAKFLADHQLRGELAVTALIDNLLDRPEYGQSWARHWLDTVRFADSLDARGSGQPGDILDSWRYRDWVVNALNSDLPYDDFIRHQIAGDLLASQKWDPDLQIATGLYAIGNWGNGDSDKLKVHTDIVDDQIDVTGRAFLGLTFSCARCHDHKFDPISTADYYSLAGFFFSSRILEQFAHPTAGESLMRVSLLSPEEQATRQLIFDRIAEIDQALNQGLRPFDQRIEQIAGNPNLFGWKQTGIDNPSLTVNLSEETIKFSTVEARGRSVVVHPGPSEFINLVWKSPASGEIQVSTTASDADPNCGDGIEWLLRIGDREIYKEALNNGFAETTQGHTVSIQAGQLLRLLITPNAEYSCDSTQIEITITDPATGQSWKLSEHFLKNASSQELTEGQFVVCGGDATEFTQDQSAAKILIAERDQLNSSLPPEKYAQGLREGGIPMTEYAGFHDAAIHVRGNYKRKTTIQPRGFPEIFNAPVPELTGSGRLALADWIASTDNPLTARVIVNRLWQHHFGSGIVDTPNNFGALGSAPTHPELLDYLAVTLMENGWSIKEMHRQICSSRTYQLSSTPTPTAAEQDPNNQFYSHQVRKKLSAEQVRDTLLMATNSLNPELGGLAVTEVSSPRRTLYLKTIRSDRTSFQLLFDGADPTNIIEQRNDSIVAPQALWLLNNEFVIKQAELLATQIESSNELSLTEKIEFLINRLFSRPAKPLETEILIGYLQNAGENHESWTKICHSLLCSNELMFID